MTVHSSFNAMPAAPGSSRGGTPPEHRCGNCFGPMGKSTIPCRNEPKEGTR